MRFSLLPGLLVVLIATPLQAHGGIYHPPIDTGAGSTYGGGNSTPPTNPQGGAAQVPGSPGAAGPNSTGSSRTGGSRGRGSGGNAPMTMQPTLFLALDTWEFWWEYNKAAFLGLKDRMVGSSNVTGSGGPSSGSGLKGEARRSRRPTIDTINAQVVPMLRQLIATSDKRDIVDSALVALARSAPGNAVLDVVTTAMPMLASKELSVQTAATLALGISGSPAACPALQALMTASAEGRQLVGGGAVPPLVRAFAALALGLVNDPGSVRELIDVVESTKDADRDLKVSAIVALGLVHNGASDEAVHYLMQKLADRKLDATVRSYIPTSLGKLGDAAAVPALLKVFLDRDADSFVRQSAAIGLGQLALLSQADVVTALRECIAEGKDQQSRHFCLISLAQIGARSADAGEAGLAEQHEALVKLLGGEITKPGHADHRSWAALAAAIYARTATDAKAPLAERLVQAWKKEHEPSFKSADALALGLLHVDSMGADLLDDFVRTNETDQKGYTAVALGFLHFTDAAEVLRQQCELKGVTPTYRLQVATGLGLMGDVPAVQTLIGTLQTAETLGVSSAVAKALGLIGDAEAVAPLRSLALDETRNVIVRAFACVALGVVCEKTSLPWNARIGANNNYRARVPAIDEVLDIL